MSPKLNSLLSSTFLLRLNEIIFIPYQIDQNTLPPIEEGIAYDLIVKRSATSIIFL